MCASIRFPTRGQVMLIGKLSDILSSEITSRAAYEEYFNRRRFLHGALATGAMALGAGRLADLGGNIIDPRIAARADTKLQTVKSPLTTTGEQLTVEERFSFSSSRPCFSPS